MIDAALATRYREEGYLLLPDLLSAAEVAELRTATDALVAAARGLSAGDALYDLEPDHRPDAPRVRRLTNPQDRHPAFAALVRHPAIVGCLTALWGPDVRFDMAKLNMKPANGGSPVEWHQDWAFYPHTNDDLAAVGIMLDDVDMENGPLLVIPGSHKGPVLDHHQDGFFVGGVDPAQLDTGSAVACTGGAGTVSIHHVRTVHASAPNCSSRPRRLLLNQYRAADAWPLINPPTDFSTYHGLLVAGEETLTPRMESLPLRLRYPPPPHRGSIFETQRALGNRYFTMG